MNCPTCNGPTAIDKHGHGSTGYWRKRSCACGCRFNTFQPADGPETVSLVIADGHPVADDKWHNEGHRQWLAGLANQVIRA